MANRPRPKKIWVGGWVRLTSGGPSGRTPDGPPEEGEFVTSKKNCERDASEGRDERKRNEQDNVDLHYR